VACFFANLYSEAGDEIPTQTRFGLTDKKRVPCSVAGRCRVEQREDYPIGVGGEHSAETGEDQAHQSRKQGQQRRTLLESRRPETRGITARMTIRTLRVDLGATLTTCGPTSLRPLVSPIRTVVPRC
jgi:hypothetical protein